MDKYEWLYESRKFFLAYMVVFIFGVLIVILAARSTIEAEKLISPAFQLAMIVIPFYFGVSKVAEAYKSVQSLNTDLILEAVEKAIKENVDVTVTEE